MTPIILIRALKKSILEWTKDLILAEKSKADEEASYRDANVYIGNPPVKQNPTKYVPYYLIQFVAGQDFQKEGEISKATAKIRIIAVAYSEDWEKGHEDALNMLTRVRENILKERIIDNKFVLNTETPVEYVIYADDTGPYTIGDMILTFDIPGVGQEVKITWQEQKVL